HAAERHAGIFGLELHGGSRGSLAGRPRGGPGDASAAWRPFGGQLRELSVGSPAGAIERRGLRTWGSGYDPPLLSRRKVQPREFFVVTSRVQTRSALLGARVLSPKARHAPPFGRPRSRSWNSRSQASIRRRPQRTVGGSTQWCGCAAVGSTSPRVPQPPATKALGDPASTLSTAIAHQQPP